jgi:ABC-type phosphate transport system substrate-binding protein
MAKTHALLVLIAGYLLLANPVALAGVNEQAIYVIAGPSVEEKQLTREEIALIFSRKRNFWSNGQRIQAVNLPPQHPLRQTLSQFLFGRSPEGMAEYWREMYFHGMLPPHVLESESAVTLFVATVPGAIGYISSCPSDGRLRVVFMVGAVENCHR